MKNFIIAASTAVLLSFGATAMADDDADITVIDSATLQVQDGFALDQTASMGIVTASYDGDAHILVKRSAILQVQGGRRGDQTARMAVAGCGCN